MDSKFFSGLADQQTIYAGWNPTGTGLAALISHKEPVYIDLVESRAVRLCDEAYSNQHTIKSLEFINDRQIITGSDHFQLFLWDIPEGDGKQKTEGRGKKKERRQKKKDVMYYRDPLDADRPLCFLHSERSSLHCKPRQIQRQK